MGVGVSVVGDGSVGGLGPGALSAWSVHGPRASSCSGVPGLVEETAALEDGAQVVTDAVGEVDLGEGDVSRRGRSPSDWTRAPSTTRERTCGWRAEPNPLRTEIPAPWVLGPGKSSR